MSKAPEWLDAGWPHIWLPYAQMQTASRPLAVVGGEGARLKLADGREMIDGVASWWTMAHGYSHPHIRACVARQLETVLDQLAKRIAKGSDIDPKLKIVLLKYGMNVSLEIDKKKKTYP